jgi:hypothetical protein
MPKLTTAALAAILSLGLAAVTAGPAAAQTTRSEQAAKTPKSGKACAGFEKGSQDHKDCMAKQAGNQTKRKGHAKTNQ